MSELASKQCVPCRGGVPPLEGSELVGYQQQLGGGWQVVGEHHLEKEFQFDDFLLPCGAHETFSSLDQYLTGGRRTREQSSTNHLSASGNDSIKDSQQNFFRLCRMIALQTDSHLKHAFILSN